MADFDFENDSQDVEKVAALLELDPGTIECVTWHTDKSATKIWGSRAMKGWLEVEKADPPKHLLRKLIRRRSK